MREVRQLSPHRLDLGRVLLCNDHGAAAGVAQHMEMALRRIARIERHAHQVSDRRPEKEIRRFEGVVLEHADAILRPEP
jgi:hypothetical protein